jgi:hypothetical protein
MKSRVSHLFISGKAFCTWGLALLVTVIVWWGTIAPASATINDDRLDGNIFVVYAGNGSLVPSKLSLAQGLERQLPTILVYYLDDSRDCKQYAFVVSRMQEFYGRATNIIPVNVDSLPSQARFQPNEPGYYYRGFVPQTVILDSAGKMIFDEKGAIAYETVDDALRKLFDLLPRSQSVTLKRRTFNEFNSELVETPSN